MNKILLSFLLLAGIVILALILLRGNEDTWMCDEDAGMWVKHGEPSVAMPTEPCGIRN